MALWYHKVEKSEFKSFNILRRTIELNYEGILNFFNNRSTNAAAESFNAKIKAFRAKFRGVKSIEFFLFRLTNIYAYSTTFSLDPRKLTKVYENKKPQQ